MNATAIIAGLMMGYVICLFLQLMTYSHKAETYMAGRQYEDETIRWAGNTFVRHLPVEYPEDL